MCLLVVHGPLTAKKSFYVVKLVSYPEKDKFQSYYMGKTHKFAPLKGKTKKKFGKYQDKYIEQGIHAISSEKYFSEFAGLESFDGLATPIAFLLCEVPKDTPFYVGRRGHIAADVMIPKEYLVSNASATKTILPMKLKNKNRRQAAKHAINIMNSYGYRSLNDELKSHKLYI